MDNDLPTSTYLKIAALIFIVPLIIIFILFNGEAIANGISDILKGIVTMFEDITSSNSIKNTEITLQNYKEIYDIVNASTDITLQEKANFNKNYLMFGRTLIGYKVKDVIKEVQW